MSTGLFQTITSSAFVHVAVVAAGLLLYVLATHLGRQRRHPSAAIGWVLAMVAFPYAGIPLFLLLGTRKLVRPQRLPVPAGPVIGHSLAPTWAARLAAGLSLPALRCNRSIMVLDDGPGALDALLALIDSARHRLDLCTFLLADDAAGQRVAGALVCAARRGVRVRVLLDAIGSLNTPRALRRGLVDAGVELRWFMPLLHNPTRGRTNLRNHRKLAVADGERMWSGGRNLAAEYFLDRPDAPAWSDLSFVVDGALAVDAENVFQRDWQLTGGRSASAARLPAADMPEGPPAQLIASGPDHADDTIYAFLLTAVHQAQNSLVAATPYFVPDDALLQALVIACRRGVRVTLLLPERSNHRLADIARARALRELAGAGARILLLPHMLHAKLMLVDDTVALCGSVNLDGRSLFLNYELTTAFYGRTEIEGFVRWFERQARCARPSVQRPPSLPRDILEGVIRVVAFQL